MKQFITQNIPALIFMALVATVLTCAWLNSQKRTPAVRHSFSRFLINLQEALYLGPSKGLQCFANTGEQTHEGAVTRLTDAAITTRNLLYKDGSDDDHIAVCGASDIPLGTVDDEADAAEELVALKLLGTGGTRKMVASEAITVGEHVYTAASGKVSDLSASAGTYYRVGVALTAASADGDVIEVMTSVPAATVVA